MLYSLNCKPALLPLIDVCIAISRKQQRYPVWFLSGCGLYPHVDPRRTGTSAALDFAKLNNLAGIVLPAKVSRNFYVKSIISPAMIPFVIICALKWCHFRFYWPMRAWF